MSEPTGDGKQQPDPEQHPEAAPGDTQDQSSGSVFNDPTAPVWADPTAPIPATPAAEVASAWVQDTPEPPLVPPAAPGASSPYGQQPPAPQVTPPASNPYAQQPPAPPYVTPSSNPYGQQYPAPPYGQQYPAPPYGQQYYAAGAPAVPSNTSAIVLTIVSGVSMLGTAFFVGIPSLIFGIMALTSNTTDPVGSRKKSRIGWIIFAVNVSILVLLIVAAIAFFVVNGTSSTTVDSGY
ncbi:MAG TPA: hypothetical protein VIJ07_04445 [Dermatophilaceae bacterium]